MGSDAEGVTFLQWALPHLGLRWPGFRKVRGQVLKRIRRRLGQLQLGGLQAYRERLQNDPAEWRVLAVLCRVTISRFYRDQGIFRRIADQILPLLAQRSQPVRCWSAGCASAEEAYTLALAAYFRGLEVEILATDIDPVMLQRARQATYPASSLRELPESWRAEAFVAHGHDRWRLKERFTWSVRLAQLDLRGPLPEQRFDLVLCRNLAFTYFDEALQRQFLQSLESRLAPGAFLVIGCHESLPDSPGWQERWPRCYQLGSSA